MSVWFGRKRCSLVTAYFLTEHQALARRFFYLKSTANSSGIYISRKKTDRETNKLMRQKKNVLIVMIVEVVTQKEFYSQ